MQKQAFITFLNYSREQSRKIIKEGREIIIFNQNPVFFIH
jgi:hypothetical protein